MLIEQKKLLIKEKPDKFIVVGEMCTMLNNTTILIYGNLLNKTYLTVTDSL